MPEPLPTNAFDLIVDCEERQMEMIELKWLISRMDVIQKRELLRLRYERDLKKLED